MVRGEKKSELFGDKLKYLQMFVWRADMTLFFT